MFGPASGFLESLLPKLTIGREIRSAREGGEEQREAKNSKQNQGGNAAELVGPDDPPATYGR